VKLNDFLSLVDVVAESPPAKPEAVLAFTPIDSFEFLDVVLLAVVRRVSRENC